MDFLQKLDFMMEKYSLNKRTLSQKSGIPYTTIDGWYKKGYDGMKLSTLRVLSDYFNTILDYWATDDDTDPNAWKANGFVVNTEEMGHIQKYRLLDTRGKEVVDNVLEVEYKHCQNKNDPSKIDIAAEVASYESDLRLQVEAEEKLSASDGRGDIGKAKMA